MSRSLKGIGRILELSERLGGDRGKHLRSFATHLTDAGRIFQGASGALETEVESFLFQLLEPNLEFGITHGAW